MRAPVPDYLSKVLRSVGDDSEGVLADYIPELANVDPDRLAVALCAVSRSSPHGCAGRC